jgi:hypothetical protein
MTRMTMHIATIIYQCRDRKEPDEDEEQPQVDDMRYGRKRVVDRQCEYG